MQKRTVISEHKQNTQQKQLSNPSHGNLQPLVQCYHKSKQQLSSQYRMTQQLLRLLLAEKDNVDFKAQW